MNIARNGTNIANGEWSGTIRFPGTTTDGGMELHLRATTTSLGTSYFVRLHRPGALILSKGVSGVYTDLAFTDYTFANSTDYHFRFRATGSLLAVKLWTSVEPSTWTLSATDTEITAAGLAVLSSTGGVAGGIAVDVDDATFDPLTTVTDDLHLSVIP
jgi:hypothetical protein